MEEKWYAFGMVQAQKYQNYDKEYRSPHKNKSDVEYRYVGQDDIFDIVARAVGGVDTGIKVGDDANSKNNYSHWYRKAHVPIKPRAPIALDNGDIPHGL